MRNTRSCPIVPWRMLCSRNHSVLLNLVAFLCCVNSGSLTRPGNAKRNNYQQPAGARSNYQMCLESFEVHGDKIIRTQDSLDMGAIYLNVTDIESREECMKFCCDTERCDVFIFEEKKPGSCYLFQCGPLYDFKCKFTNHANYSSAVHVKYNGRANAPVEEVQISQQEHELKSLRKPVDSAPVEYQYTEAPIRPITTLAPRTLAPATPPKIGCTRNQFKCVSTGECLAIYNVCDGVAQCADGSDEAAETACPVEKTTISTPIVAQPVPVNPQQIPFSPVADVPKYQQAMEQRKPMNPLYSRALEGNPRQWELANLARQTMLQPGLAYPPPQQLEVPQMRKGYNQRYQPEYQPVYEQNNEMYNQNALRAQSSLSSYDQSQPHIFNHKGPGLMGEPETDNNAYVDVRRPYPHMAPPNRPAWQENNEALSSSLVVPNVQFKPNNEAPRIETTTAVPCDVPIPTEKDIPVAAPEVKKPPPKLDQQHQQEHRAEETGQEKPKLSTVKTETKKANHVPVKAQREHKSVIVIEEHDREHGGKSAVAEHLQQEVENAPLRPKGAVISLALGLTVTAITAALIACRLRVVKKRGKRGHGPYGHNADYLVNGMYL